MTQQEFSDSFRCLVMAFSVQKPDDKAEVYFQKLSKLSGKTFEQTCNYIIENGDKFPPISRILDVARQFPDTLERSQFECKECDGSGMVSKWLHGFRCRCLNGERIGKRIPLVPVSTDEKKFWYGKLNKEWNDLYGVDLVEGKSYKGPAQPEMVDKLLKTFGMMPSR